MSGILGIFNLDQQPLKSALLNKMADAMDYWGPDGINIWCQGSIGLGHLMLKNTPESLNENLPLVSDCKNFVITATARLDNRSELIKSLGLACLKDDPVPDSFLMLEAYKKWGSESPCYLLGDWAMAIWDNRKKRAFLARDHYGLTGLYYYHDSRIFVFSSCLKGLLALKNVPRQINETRLAQILVAWPEHGPATIYQHISRLPPAHLLDISRTGIQVRQYWYLEDTSPLYLKSDQEYVEAFLDIYNKAVKCRLRSAWPIGSTLSGGLDSGSVSILAARELAKEGKKLQTFSSVPLYNNQKAISKNRFSDETPFIQATIQSASNIKAAFIRAENITPFKGIEKALKIHSEPIHAVGTQYWLIAIREEAQKQGIRTLLTGQHGNTTVSWQGSDHLAQLAWSLQLKGFFKELRAIKKNYHKSFSRIISAQILKPIIPVQLRAWYHYFRYKTYPWEKYSAISRDFTTRLNLLKLMQIKGHDPWFDIGGNPYDLRLKLIKPGRSLLGCLLQQSGASSALEIRDPTADKRVLEFCLSIPDDQYVRNGINRFLIRRAMQGILPDKVRLNNLRGAQSGDLVKRLMNCFDEFRAGLAKIEESHLAREYLDLKKMHQVLNSLKSGTKSEQSLISILLRGLMVGFFIFDLENNSLT